MTASVVSICNIALGRIGDDQLIESIDDRNPRARACKSLYDEARLQVLQDFPWNFAQASVALAELTTDPPAGWAFVYRYPSDCLSARAITDANGKRGLTGPTAITWDQWTRFISPRMPFTVMADPATAGARLIATDVEEAVLWYTQDVTLVEQMTPLFRSALAWRLAADLAGPLRANANLRQAAENAYVYVVSQAQAASLNEEAPDPPPESPSILARL